MATLEELRSQRETLAQCRASGLRAVQYADGSRNEYKSDAEMAAALADLDRQIAAASAPCQPTRFRFVT
ncbi:phage head-tail joining protein [Azospirillum sp. sgz301742]